MDFWQVLDIAPTGELKPIKKAYAAKLKQCKPDKDPEGYQQLREAFETAKDFARYFQSLEPQQQVEALAQFDADAAYKPPEPTSEPTKQPQQTTESAEPTTNQSKEQQKQALWQSYQDKAVESYNYVFAVSSPKVQAQRLEEVLERDDFQTIEARHILSSIFMHAVTNWPSDKKYPADTVQQMANKFGWYEQYADQQTSQMLNIIKDRCDAQYLYAHLLEDGIAIREGRDENMIKAINLLNSPFERRQARWVNFRAGAVRNKIYQLIHTLLDNFDFRFYPNLNKANVRWWLDQEQQFNFTLWPFIATFALAIFALSSLPELFQNRLTSVSENTQLLIYMGTMPVVFALGYLAFWLHYYIKKRMTIWYFIRWRPWLDEHQLYRWFVLAYLILFVLAGYVHSLPLSTESLAFFAFALLALTEGTKRIFHAVLLNIIATWMTQIPAFKGLNIEYMQTFCLTVGAMALVDWLVNFLPPERVHKMHQSSIAMPLTYIISVVILCIAEFSSRQYLGGL